MENLKHGSRKPNVKVNGLVDVYGMKFHDIEGGFGKDKKSMLVRDIAEIHGREEKYINRNINNNRKWFKDGLDIIDLKVGEYKSLSLKVGYSNQSYANANNIYLLSERGYSKLLKILEDDFAWEQYDKLVDGYFQMREQFNSGQALNTSELSPQLQMFNQMFQAMANTELEIKKVKAVAEETNEKLEETKEELEDTKEEIQGIRNIVSINTSTISWREECRKLIVKMAHSLGGNKYISEVNKEIYSLMRIRLKCKLDVQLTNMRRRMADEGVCKSKRDKLNYLDVIARDSRLIEGYVAIVKELAIKYGA